MPFGNRKPLAVAIEDETVPARNLPLIPATLPIVAAARSSAGVPVFVTAYPASNASDEPGNNVAAEKALRNKLK